MASPTRLPRVATAAISAASLCISIAFGQENDAPDPWFTKDHKAQREEQKKESKPLPGLEREDEESVTLKRANPSTLVKRLRKELRSVPETNLGKRIALLEQIINTDRPKDEDVEELKTTTHLRRAALAAIAEANQDKLAVPEAIAALAPYARYFTGDSELLIALLKSEFSNRLDSEVSSLSRRNQSTQLQAIKAGIEEAGLGRVFGNRIQFSAGEAASAMVARRWAELLDETSPLPGEAYLIGQLLGQGQSKLALAVDLPASTDPRLTNSIARGLQTEWGDTFALTTLTQREISPDFVLSVDVRSIKVSNTVDKRQVASTIPGAVVEEPNPDFLKLVERYEKAAKGYESALAHYEMMYEDYIESMNNDEFREAQQDLEQAKAILAATPPPSGPNPEQAQAYNEALGMVQTAEATANAIGQPLIVEPTPPYPHHLKILEDLHLVPSTLIISAEETPYEYTEKTLDFAFTASAPMSLEIPQFDGVAVQGNVSIEQARNWIANEGVHPRDPTATEGTYSEAEYESALNMFGLEFATACARALHPLLRNAREEIQSQTDPNSLRDNLLLLALKSATDDLQSLTIEDQELQRLTELAANPNIDAREFRSACLAILLSKTDYSHMADEKAIRQLL